MHIFSIVVTHYYGETYVPVAVSNATKHAFRLDRCLACVMRADEEVALSNLCCLSMCNGQIWLMQVDLIMPLIFSVIISFTCASVALSVPRARRQCLRQFCS